MESEVKQTLGQKPARYGFLINPYVDVRLSRCPSCQKLTHVRKFALFVHIQRVGPVVLGKSCRYCTPCELIMVHQNELESALAERLPLREPGDPKEPYFVVGTVDLKTWRAGLQTPLWIKEDVFPHLADFQRRFNLGVSGGWGPATGADVRDGKPR